MTTCVTDVCGTGDWAGPKPGDPSTNSVLNAVPVWGGIRVSWSWPSTNPHAVAHVQLYRNSVNDLSTAIQLAIVAGSHYVDPLETAQTKYYWIKIVSVNGTISEFIGPVWATSIDTAEGMIEYLTGQIDRGFLAMSLKEELDRIELLNTHLLGEIASREDANVTLAQAIADAQDGVAQALTFVGQVNASRVSDDQAIVDQLGVIAATLQNGIAMVTDEARASVTRVEGLIAAETTSRQQVTAQLDSKYATITTNANTKITQLEGGLSAEVSNRQQAITNVGGRVTGVESSMSTLANTVSGIYTAMWTIRLQSGGLIGSFGIYNNGQTVEAGFDVDSFWIGRTQANKRKPFIISGGVVYLDTAVIANASIGTAKIADAAITTAKIVDGQITKAKIGDGAIINAKIGNGEITTAKIGHAQIDTLRVAGQAITVPVGASLPSDSNIVGGQPFLSVSFTSDGSPTWIAANVRHQGSGGGVTMANITVNDVHRGYVYILYRDSGDAFEGIGFGSVFLPSTPTGLVTVKLHAPTSGGLVRTGSNLFSIQTKR